MFLVIYSPNVSIYIKPMKLPSRLASATCGASPTSRTRTAAAPSSFPTSSCSSSWENRCTTSRQPWGSSPGRNSYIHTSILMSLVAKVISCAKLCRLFFFCCCWNFCFTGQFRFSGSVIQSR